MPRNDAKGKCTCNLGFMVVAWILFAAALWVLVGAFATQFTSGAPTMFSLHLFGWYLGGIIIAGIGKMAKWKAHGNCSVHKM